MTSTSTIVIYRCSECGATSTSLGGIHGHIESHRPAREFYRIGWDVEFLYARTERYEIPIAAAAEYRTDTDAETPNTSPRTRGESR